MNVAILGQSAFRRVRLIVIERLGWLHISDLHLKSQLDTWSQDVTLRDLIDDVATRASNGLRSDFVVVSGDLAFSGAAGEYRHVAAFLDTLGKVLSLPRNRIFVVAGNHDVNRTLRKTCHLGALRLLTSPQTVEEFLGDTAEREELLERQAAFRAFRREFHKDADLGMMPDGLGYVTKFNVDVLPLCVVGLNSAWLANGGDSDEHNIVIGDRQIINACDMVKALGPQLVIGVMHHPTEWLRSFDRQAVENRVFSYCDFLHRGHLHEPDVRRIEMTPSRRCLIIATGAAHAARTSSNSYSIVNVDLGAATCYIHTLVYSSTRGSFEGQEVKTASVELRGPIHTTVDELREAIGKHVPQARGFCHYLSAVLLGLKSDVPTILDDQVIFATPSVLDSTSDRDAIEATKSFLALKNLLRAFAVGTSIDDRIIRLRERVVRYATFLQSLADTNRAFAAALSQQESQARTFAQARQPLPYAHTRALLQDLAATGDWSTLEIVARKHIASPDSALSIQARRMLAMSLAQADDPQKSIEAAELILQVVRGQCCTATDITLAATVLMNLRRDDDARLLLIDACQRFPTEVTRFADIAQKVVVVTGDIALRDMLKAALIPRKTIS